MSVRAGACAGSCVFGWGGGRAVWRGEWVLAGRLTHSRTVEGGCEKDCGGLVGCWRASECWRVLPLDQLACTGGGDVLGRAS